MILNELMIATNFKTWLVLWKDFREWRSLFRCL